MFLEMLVSFTAFWLLFSHLSPRALRRMLGYKGWVDLILHTTIILLFMGSAYGLLQAEGAAILFSISLRVYAKLFGYERLTVHGWQRYAGYLTGRV